MGLGDVGCGVTGVAGRDLELSFSGLGVRAELTLPGLALVPSKIYTESAAQQHFQIREVTLSCI